MAESKQMKAALLHEWGGELSIENVPIPQCDAASVLVRVMAASVNPIDFKLKSGALKLAFPYPLPLIMGYDFAGEVAQVGEDVKTFKVGDHVFGRADDGFIGTFAEYIAVSEHVLAIKPALLTFGQAASIPLVGLTTVQAFERAGVKEGHKVIVSAGCGGVGSFAVQFAKHVLKANVTTTASGVKVDLCSKLGADTVVNYKEADFVETLPHDYDFAFDTTGEAMRLMDVLKPGGYCVSISTSPDSKELLRKSKNFRLGCCVKGLLTCVLDCKDKSFQSKAKKRNINYSYLFMSPSGQDLSKIASYLEQQLITPLIDRTYNLDQINEALQYLQGGRATGKVVIAVVPEKEKEK